MAQFKAVFLDIGGVILQIDWARPFAFAGVFDVRRRRELIAAFHGSSLFHDFEKGLIQPNQFFAGLGLLMGKTHPEKFWREAWQSLIMGELPDIRLIFDSLQGRVPVYALTNTNVVHFEYQMRRFPILKRFTKIIASHELEERKPDAAFFLKACQECGVEPNEALFVDDTFENVEGARRVGIKSCQTVNSVRGTIEFLRRCLVLPDDTKV